MNSKLWTAVGVGAGVGALTMGAITFANAENTTPSPSSSSQSQFERGKGMGMHETPLTGEDAEKATAAAQQAVPDGTVLRVETDADGTYEAHVRKADGTEVEVKMDANFAVTGVEEFTGRGGHGGMNETPLTGEDAEKATAAAQAEVPNGTVLRVETDADGTYEAHVRKADGTEVVVKMDANFAVTGVEEFTGRGGHGRMGEKQLTGAKAKKVTSAAKAKFPNGTVLRVEKDSDGTYEAHVLKANGTEVEVTMNKNFKITSVQEHAPMGHHGPMRGATPSSTASANA